MKNIKLILFVLLPYLCHSQNLIPNSSFEEEISFNGDKKGDWIKCIASDSPDIFSFSDTNTLKLFNEYLGGIPPKSGNVYAGIFCIRNTKSFSQKEVREFIQCPLITSLEKGRQYNVEFYVALDPESNVSINSLGLYFSKDKVSVKTAIEMFKRKPQIKNNRKRYLNNKDDWIKVNGTYTAKGGENYISIGNFKPDLKTRLKPVVQNTPNLKKEKWNIKSNEILAYYYIDDIKIERMVLATTISHNDTINLTIDDSKSLKAITEIKSLSVGDSIILKKINFEFDKADLLETSLPELKNLINFLNKSPTIKIQIRGHTDALGEEEYNQKLSKMRADSVKRYLVINGISKDRLKCIGYGAIYPIADNNTDEGQDLNRRVEIKILKQ